MLPLVALLDDVSSAVSLATEIAPGLGPNRTFGRAGSTSIGDVSLRVGTPPLIPAAEQLTLALV